MRFVSRRTRQEFVRTVWAGVAGGLILFVWGTIGHVGIGLYDAVFHNFADEGIVLETIEHQAPRSGLYFAPAAYEDRDASLHVLVNVAFPDAQRPFGLMMITGLMIHMVSMLLVTLLLLNGMSDNYWRRVGSFSATGTIIAFVANAYYWNWFSFPALYFALSIGDALVGWTLAGLASAAIIGKRIRQQGSS